MVKIKVAQDQIENIKQRIRDKGWNIDRNSSEVIPEANKQQLKKIFKNKNINYQTTIKISDLDILIKQDKRFTPNSENKLRDYIHEQKENGRTEIEIQDFWEYFDQEEDIRLKSFTQRSYMDFISGKEIEKEVFQVFCEVIGINNWKSVVPQDSIYFHTYILSDSLAVFNHETQVRDFKIGLNDNQIFGVTNSCSYSCIWMLKRLETEICRLTTLKCKRINLRSSGYLSLEISNIKTKFSENNLDFLKKENIFVFLDTEPYTLEDIENLIENYWYPLLRKMPINAKGKLIMFLLNKESYQQELQKRLNLINIQKSNLFDSEGIAALLSEIMLRNNHQSDEKPLKIAERILNNSNNNTKNLLINIFTHFLQQPDQVKQELSRWEKYL